MDFIAQCGANKSIFLLVGYKVDLLGHQIPHSQNNLFSPSCTIYYFLPPSRKKNRVRHGKNINFTRVVTPLCSGIKLHTRKINALMFSQLLSAFFSLSILNVNKKISIRGLTWSRGPPGVWP